MLKDLPLSEHIHQHCNESIGVFQDSFRLNYLSRFISPVRI
ncbi:hypothetical protein [Bathymodiolus japonicus methanotrophic gill symbiont]|nr:hypothetical protein [Bathymodiolus japonicus methanotrophic gill symbiont]